MSVNTTQAAIIAAVTTVNIGIGATISYLARRAATRTGSRSMWLFSYGFGAITLGLLAGGAGALFLGLSAEGTVLVQGLLLAPGFALLLKSLYSMPRSVGA